KFHNGDPFTAEDVKFSFHRAKGAKLLREKVKDVEIVSPTRVRFHLHEPWPDFMNYYGGLVSGAGWIVPKKYVEKVGDDGFKKAPVGLGPYKFVSHTPGIELVMEAFEGYWRKMPSVKRVVFKSVPESTTRMAMLKRGEVDIAYLLDVPQAEQVKRDPNLKLAFSGGIAIFFLDFLDQWDPKSPWHDKRVRQAASYAIDRKALSEVETLGARDQEAEGRLRVHQRVLRQRRLAHVRGHPERRLLRLRRLSRYRRALQAAGARDRPPQAGGRAPPDPAARPRAREARADLRV